MSQKVKSPISKRFEGVAESATLKLNATVQALKAQGVDVVNFTAGEPDFSVPKVAEEAVVEALKSPQCNKYTPVPGIMELRQAVADKTNRQQPEVSAQNPWKASNVIITNGGKQAIFNAMMAMLDPGDEVLIPSPYWLSYPEMVRITGGIPKFIPASFQQGFKITPAQLKKALGPKVKILILNSPSNPTGMMYSKEEYRALAEVLKTTPGAENVWILSDEIYDRIILGDKPFCSFLEAAPELQNRTITLNGMSKSAAMTGWRVGWSVAPAEVTQAMITLQGQSTSGINALVQRASIATLKLPEEYFAPQIKTFRARRDLLVENLEKVSALDMISPEGAFYLFVGVGKYLRAGEDSIQFAQRLLEEANVAVVAGTPFGEPEFIRLSFATDEKTIQKGCDRIVSYLQKA